MITSSASLLILYVADFPRAWLAFHLLWIINAATYVFITGFCLLIDPQTARHTWRQALVFPGAVNLAIIVYSCFPRLFRDGARIAGIHWGWGVVFIYAWPAASMVVAYLAKVAEPGRLGRFLSPLLVYLVGYGSLLCACTFASYLSELRHQEMTWEKTEKTGKVGIPG
jgi:hypothetical protein